MCKVLWFLPHVADRMERIEVKGVDRVASEDFRVATISLIVLFLLFMGGIFLGIRPQKKVSPLTEETNRT